MLKIIDLAHFRFVRAEKSCVTSHKNSSMYSLHMCKERLVYNTITMGSPYYEGCLFYCNYQRYYQCLICVNKCPIWILQQCVIELTLHVKIYLLTKKCIL